MIKYRVEAYFIGEKYRTIKDEYGERELNSALQNITGLIREGLIAKKLAIEYIHLYKIIEIENKKEEVLLMYFNSEEFSNRYVISKLGGNKNEKENAIKSNNDNFYDVFD